MNTSWRTRLGAALLALTTGAASVAAQDVSVWAAVGGGIATRSAAVAGQVSQGTGTLPFVEAGVRYRAVSLQLRGSEGEFAPEAGEAAAQILRSGEALLGASWRALSVDAGLGARTVAGPLGSRTFTHSLARARLEVPLGHGSFLAGASATLWLGGTERDGSATSEGRVIETYLRVRSPAGRLFAQLSYRVEAFTIAGTDTFPDETGSVQLSLGVGRGRR